MPYRKVTVFETSEYVAAARRHLSDPERDAIRHYLAANPLVGKPSKEYEALYVLEWGHSRPIEINYIVSADLKTSTRLFAVIGFESGAETLYRTRPVTDPSICQKSDRVGYRNGAAGVAQGRVHKIEGDN